MNGAESLARTLLGAGVDVCFTNPGTSEMHFVAALDRVEGMRCVLGLFEGVATGAADGYARMADKPAATLLHLGPGLANGLANLHNARRACSPIVNIVGDHATYHRRFDAPLTADIEGFARPVSRWVCTARESRWVARDAAAAIVAARRAPGGVATLILPADVAWGAAAGPVATPAPPPPSPPAEAAIDEAARALRSGEPCVILMTGRALRAPALEMAGRIAAATGARLMRQTSNARTERGAGRVAVEKLPYPVDLALERLAGVRHIVLVGAKPPVAFFAYPDKPSRLAPPECAFHRLASPEEDAAAALEALADALGARAVAPPIQALARPALPRGELSPEAIAAALGALMPENAIVADESITAGVAMQPMTVGAPPHDWLQVTGGSIGIGMPLATGAAVACPDRKVICLEGDGSGMYTLQALWTQAREGLDVTTVVFANRAYAILKHELAKVGAGNPGRKAADMLEIGRPDLDWVAMARGMGVEAGRAETADAFADLLARGLATPGPFLIEAVL